MIENWKDIKNYEGLYQISDLGRVKSLQRLEICGGRAKQRIRRERFLRPALDKYGYLKIVLCKNGKTTSFHLHRLVLSSFKFIPIHKPVNHKDGNKLNNKLENLEWCSTSENAIHAYDLGLYHSGEKHYKAKLTNENVTEIKQLLLEKISFSKIAVKFQVSDGTIHDIAKGRTWKRHVVFAR